MCVEEGESREDSICMQSGGENTMFVRYKIPTLSELIEACGDKFGQLIKPSKKEWMAIGIEPKHKKCKECGQSELLVAIPFGEGKTPEEAMSKLWLELNK